MKVGHSPRSWGGKGSEGVGLSSLSLAQGYLHRMLAHRRIVRIVEPRLQGRG